MCMSCLGHGVCSARTSKSVLQKGERHCWPVGRVGTRRQRGHPWHEMHEVTMPCAYPRGLHKLASCSAVYMGLDNLEVADRKSVV